MELPEVTGLFRLVFAVCVHLEADCPLPPGLPWLVKMFCFLSLSSLCVDLEEDYGLGWSICSALFSVCVDLGKTVNDVHLDLPWFVCSALWPVSVQIWKAIVDFHLDYLGWSICPALRCQCLCRSGRRLSSSTWIAMVGLFRSVVSVYGDRQGLQHFHEG